MAVKTLQITIGASATQLSSTALYAKWVAFQNNGATNAMRVGDSAVTTSRGYKLLSGGGASGTLKVEESNPGEVHNLSQWYVAGTQNDVLDVIYGDINYAQ